ncbi:Actin filament capping protein muscle Z-line beta [Fasciola gigantica]|uniref:F-actin-capping protein subunit beta n=1 Tax=Fasciola gigantica TaxID=46835 RepID=A0A504Z3F4_FASGI|nr:Actin filament capping protein muscle Z-line beta [Fasciola gigantica]
MNNQLNSVMDLMRRLPPQKIDRTLLDVINLVPDLCEDILSSIDQPLKIARDAKAGRDYLLCDYNRDGDSYRSPWSNTYDPPIEDGAMPSESLRKREIEINAAFDQYREMYYEGGISSVYLWDMDLGFAGVILIKKAGDAKLASGCWDSIHVIDVMERSSAKIAQYKLTSTVMLWLQTQRDQAGYFNLGGSLTRFLECDRPLGEAGVPITTSHIVNIGRMVEDAENSIRSTLNEVYFGTTKNIVDSLRSLVPASEEEKRRRLVQEVHSAIQHKAQT